jgi:hypothetical protein
VPRSNKFEDPKDIPYERKAPQGEFRSLPARTVSG